VRRTLGIAALLGLLYLMWKRSQDEMNAVPLANKAVIVTGAAAGIGRAIAHAFAREQAHLLLVDRDAERLAKVQDEVARYGTRVIALSADLTDEGAPQDIVDYAVQTFGRIDVLVNNAGQVISGDMTLHDDAAIRAIFEINTLALIRLTQAVVRVMKAQRSGHIVSIASSAATMPSPGYVVYGASKGAVTTFSHALRRELAPDGVRVSYIAPGWVNTQMIWHMPPERMQAASLVNPLLRLDISEPADVARAVIQAVVYNRHEVIVGGLGFWAVALLHRLSPRLADMIYAQLTDTRAILETTHRPA
jgi:short-subunit dehydrogenase